MDCVVIALSQMSRECEKRPDKRGQLSDLRDSGEIEQAADVVIFLYREELYQPDTPNKGVIEMIVRKNRHGGLGTAYGLAAFDVSRIDDHREDSSQPLCRHRARRAHAFRKGARSDDSDHIRRPAAPGPARQRL